jgi:phage recombination protein Bet
MMSNAVATYNASSLRVLDRGEPTPDEIAVIKATVMPQGSTDAELKTFLGWCAWKGLDPVGQAYAFRQGGKQGQGGKLVFGTSIHGMRSIAARTGLYGPQDGPYWCGEDGAWKDLWLAKENPAAARVGVKQVGWDTYTYGTATWQQWGKSFGNWLTMPAHMLAIRAEADALRRAFPHDLAGVYTKDELEDAPEMAASPVRSGTVSAELVDDETGEIIDVEPERRITRDQVTEIVTIKQSMGWKPDFVKALSDQAVGKTDAAQLTEDEATVLLEVMRAEVDKELQQGLAS